MAAMRLGQLCEQLEHAGRAGNSEQCLNLSRQLDVTIDEADTMIRAHLEHL